MARTYSNPDLAAALGKPPAALLHDVKGLLPKPDMPGHRRLSLADCAVVALYLEAKRVGLGHYPARMIFGSAPTHGFVSGFLDWGLPGAKAPLVANPAAWAERLRQHPVLIGAIYDASGDMAENMTADVRGITATPFMCQSEQLPEHLARLREQRGGRLRGTIFATAMNPALLRLVPMMEDDA